MTGAAALIDALGLEPHVEGGHWAQTWIGPPGPDDRPVGTAIVYLLAAGERSRWHRVDATEVWHFHTGAPLTLRTWDGTGATVARELGPDPAAGHRPQLVVPPGVWQSAVSAGPYTMAGCTVAPGFVDAGFELAPAGWEPPG